MMVAKHEEISDIIQRNNATINASLKQLEQTMNDAKSNIEKEKEAFRLWAYYGWTIVLTETLGFYRTPPLNLGDADRRLMKWFQFENSIDNYFERKKMLKVNQADFDEAKKVFNLGFYKACSMLLVAMIENLLLKSQKQSGVSDIKVGGGAINNLTHLVASDDPFTVMIRWNTLCYLKYLFDTDRKHWDFVDEPDIVNRNFLMHGMTTRNISKIDCIKLFVALENVSILIYGYRNTYEQEKL